MDQDLPVGNFCPLHLTSLAQTATLGEAKPHQQGVNKALWLTLLTSLLVHIILLTIWAAPLRNVKRIVPEPNVRITLNTTVSDTAVTETVPEQEFPTVEEPITDSPLLPENTATVRAQEAPAVEESMTPEPPPRSENTTASEVITKDSPQSDIRTLGIEPHYSFTAKKSAPGNVFHPGLRGRVRDARARRERLHNTGKPELSSWQDASGTTWMDLGDGTCMRSTSDAQGATTGWELPKRCKGQLTEGESMLRAMQKTLDRR